jgi:hypothetical protein
LDNLSISSMLGLHLHIYHESLISPQWQIHICGIIKVYIFFFFFRDIKFFLGISCLGSLCFICLLYVLLKLIIVCG